METHPALIAAPGRLESYGRIGPYGEVLWYLLRDVKARFIERIVERWNTRPEQALRAVRTELGEATTWLDTYGETFVERLVANWPESVRASALAPECGGEPQARAALATLRLNQHRDYLQTCRDFADVQRRKEVDCVDQLRDALHLVLWPYFFIRHGDKVVTWIPPADLLDTQTAVSPGARKVGPGADAPMRGTLYPSLFGALGGGGEAMNQLLRLTIGMGSSSMEGGASDLGYVQHFRNEPFGYKLGIIDEAAADQRVWFVDAFHFNRTGFCFSPESPLEDHSPHKAKGLLWWCGPTENLLRRLARVYPSWEPEKDGRDASATWPLDLVIEKESMRAWDDANGPKIADSISKQYDKTVSDFLPTYRRESTFSALKLIQHSVKGGIETFYAAHAPSDTVKMQNALRLLQVEKLVVQAAITGYRCEVGEDVYRVRDAWNGFVVDGVDESFGRTLEYLYQGGAGPLVRIEDVQVRSEKVDPRLMAIVAELCRNIVKHRKRNAPCTPIYIRVDGTSVSVRYQTPFSKRQLTRLQTSLRLASGTGETSGAGTVAWLARTLGGLATWTAEDGCSDARLQRLSSTEDDYVLLAPPHADDITTLSFEATGLLAV